MTALDFDDVLLIPHLSRLESRDEVSLKTRLGPNLVLEFPIIASPMKGIISFQLVLRLSELGGIGILHRFYDTRELWMNDLDACSKYVENFGVAVKLDTPLDDIKMIVDMGAKIICLDVANGYLRNVRSTCEKFSSITRDSGCLLMAGNVVTKQGALELSKNCGVDLIRVGIGSGNLCTTRINTGIGIPQLSAIEMCRDVPYLIADGGIRNAGDIVKALSFGASAVLVGSLFARTYESSHNGIIYGMASRKLQEEYYHLSKSIEGVEKEATKDMSVEELIDGLCWNIKSAFTYLGVKDLDSLHYDSEIWRLNNNFYVEVQR